MPGMEKWADLGDTRIIAQPGAPEDATQEKIVVG